MITQITQRELTAMRRTLSLSLPDLATRQTLTTAADGMGGVTETWASTYNTPCRLQALTARPSGEGGRFVVAAGWKAILPHDQAMSSGDRLVIGGQTYEVLSVEDAGVERIGRAAYLRRLD